MTIAQIVHDNEIYFGLSEADIHDKVRVSTYAGGWMIYSGISPADAYLGGNGRLYTGGGDHYRDNSSGSFGSASSCSNAL